ncbi:MAG: 4Fe-4S binding protein [Neomegalonema sp.]|nr:4Fe-4S binding protein [Neomegalonema sp.]
MADADADAAAELKTRGEVLLLCDCEGSGVLPKAAQNQANRACSSLCQADIGVFTAAATQAAKTNSALVVGCAQEAARFEELLMDMAEADGAKPPTARFVDLRDRAFWSDEATDSAPKIAALLAVAALPQHATPAREVASEGVCLVYGRGETALRAASRLENRLAVTCMLIDGDTEGSDPAPVENRHLTRGRIRRLSGALGNFELTIDGFAERAPGGRGGLAFDAPRDGASTRCDIVIDLSGETPLAPAPAKRDGYLRADPADPIAVERLLFEAVDLVGAFDKPLHIRFEASLCAHSRAHKSGCDRCLTVCPTGAITAAPGAEHVEIDPLICAGCGACAAVCPSGAALYDDPPASDTLLRMRTLFNAFLDAGGEAPRLLFHDSAHGREMIALAARHYQGLPADLLPLEFDALSRVGHDLMLGALAMGYRSVEILLSPTAEKEVIEAQRALAERIAAQAGFEGRIILLDLTDPEALAEQARAPRPEEALVERIAPLEEGRKLTRQAASALMAGKQLDKPIDLTALEPAPPGGAPYGAVLVDSQSCTLCLSCVSLCPSGALGDNPDRPELRFQEDACLQCGLCAATCPEDAITYAPRLNLSDAALRFETLHEEEPFACIECGALFGVKSTIERVTEKLVGKNWMYTNSDNARLIQMCDDCRVRAQVLNADNPFQLGTPQRPRTTDDYQGD